MFFLLEKKIAEFFGIKNSARIIFAANATLGINIILQGILKPGMKVATTSLEHNAITRTLNFLTRKDINTKIVDCDNNGNVFLKSFEKICKEGIDLIIVTHSSNVIGNILPITEIGKIAHAYGVLFMVDCSQTAGIEDISITENNIDILVCSGHKYLYGIQGSSIFYINEKINIEPILFGGTGTNSLYDNMPMFLPEALEPGTFNTAAIASISAGIGFIKKEGIEKIRFRKKKLTDILISGLNCIKRVSIYGDLSKKRSSVISFNLKNKACEQVGQLLDEKFNIAIRSGLHCSPWAHRTIGTIDSGTIRVSVGYFNNIKEIEYMLECIENIAKNE